jgi:hypothetical protein
MATFLFRLQLHKYFTFFFLILICFCYNKFFLFVSRQMGRLESQCHADDIISDDEDNDEDASSCSTSASANLCNDEIPIYVRGEQRWVSGVTEHTSCNDLIEALLCDDSGSNLLENPVKLSDFVITERWRRVEQVLDGKTKIFKIWTAWGEAQPEVRIFFFF